MEDNVRQLREAGIAVELLTGQDINGAEHVGIRLRTFGKLLPKNKMVIASAPTFEGALGAAIDKAQGGRWETLDWSKVPWERRAPRAATVDFGI